MTRIDVTPSAAPNYISDMTLMVDSCLQVKIADFGLVVKTYEKRPRGFRGTRMFMAPEMANRLPYGTEVRTWCSQML